MAFTLKSIVPWGRSFDEYVAMFALSNADLQKKILGCSDGPASFNCVLTQKGGHIISVDPLYQFNAQEIEKRIHDTYQEVIEQADRNKHEFVWNSISSVKELGRIRMEAMKSFLSDYPKGLSEGRYVVGSLPALPFARKRFDIALSSHFLFLYSTQLSEEFHIQSIKELCRIAHEVRVFPLLELGSIKSRHIESVKKKLIDKDLIIAIEKVPYEFQKGGNEMMTIMDKCTKDNPGR